MTMTRKRAATRSQRKESAYDVGLIIATLALVGMGLLMVTSASMVMAERQYHQAFYFLYHQLFVLSLGFVGLLAVLRIPVSFIERYSSYLLLLALALLVVVLVPGLGRQVNGSTRWLSLGIVHMQVSELAKLFFVLYLAGYIQRHQSILQTTLAGFLKPLALMGVACALLLLEPDFGASVVILITGMAMLFAAGAKLRYVVVMVVIGGVLLAFIAIASPYRLERLTTFLHPWQHQFDSGYQLTQSLIAFGRGGLTGVGLGNSIQKLFYLPEAHTDFLLAVIAEELGLVGVLCVIGLFVWLILRILLIAKRALQQQLIFSGYTAFGIGVWFAFQALVNVGVNAGMFPTKGLTLPFMSYGGSSIIVNCMVIGLLLRIDYETKRGSRR